MSRTRVRTGKNVADIEDIRRLAEASKNIEIRTSDDEEHDAITAVDTAPRGRVIKTADDARGRDLEMIMQRLDRLEATMNAAAWEINLHNKFLVEFRTAFGKMLFYPFYRFVIWIFPIPLPPYKQGKTVPYIKRQDRRPHNGGNGNG